MNLRAHVMERQLAADTFANRQPMADQFSQHEIASRLNTFGVAEPRGERWSQPQVRRVLRRLASDGAGPDEGRLD